MSYSRLFQKSNSESKLHSEHKLSFNSISSIRDPEDEIVIYQSDVNQVLDEYYKIKSCIKPTSKYIKQLQAFNKNLISNKPLTDQQLHSLASLLKLIFLDQKKFPHTFDACDKLFDKMGCLTDCLDFDMKIFSKIICHPELNEYMFSIKQKSGRNYKDLTHLILEYPDALKYIALDEKFTFTAIDPNNCAKVINPQFLVSACRVIDELKVQDARLYNHFVIINKPTLSFFKDPTKPTGYYGLYSNQDTLVNRSINQNYNASLASQENIDFILKYAEHAPNIGYILNKLHHAMLGKIVQDKVESSIRKMEGTVPEAFDNLAFAFQHLSINLCLNQSYSELILQICEPQNRMSARELALTATEEPNRPRYHL